MKDDEQKLYEAVLGALRVLQENPDVPPMPCPQCGKNRMKREMAENALSRYIPVYICSECGVDEALPRNGTETLPLEQWELIKRITGK